VPHIPSSAPSRGSNTGETQIELILTPLTGTNTGGSPITSYIVLWNSGSGSTMSILLGDIIPNTLTTVLITTGISSGNTYRFAYYARNIHGDGWDSVTALPYVDILAATKPSQMIAPNVAYLNL
jgi:hypothetical protein